MESEIVNNARQYLSHQSHQVPSQGETSAYQEIWLREPSLTKESGPDPIWVLSNDKSIQLSFIKQTHKAVETTLS